MDDRILFQVIEGSIHDGMRDGFNEIVGQLPTIEDQFRMAALTGLLASDTEHAIPFGGIVKEAFDIARACMMEKTS